MDWNFGDILDTVEAAIDPKALAFAHGARTLTWGEQTDVPESAY